MKLEIVPSIFTLLEGISIICSSLTTLSGVVRRFWCILKCLLTAGPGGRQYYVSVSV